MAKRWVLVIGDGLAVEGPCLLHSIAVNDATSGYYADIYDGRDATSGKKLCRVRMGGTGTRPQSFAGGIRMDRGVYVDGQASTTETLIVFESLPE